MIETMTEKRERIFREVHAIRSSTEKLNEKDPYYMELEFALANLFPTLEKYALIPLYKNEFEAGGEFHGFLLNVGFEQYVSTDDGKWLYASEKKVQNSIFWTMSANSSKHLVLKALSNMYFNWRALTGACKLYDSYDEMVITWDSSRNDTFSFKSEYWKQNIGARDTDDNELYVRQNIVYTNFRFMMFDESKFTEEDRLIYDAYLKYGGQLRG